MSNKRIVIAVNLAVALALILANAAFAVPLKKQAHPRASKEKVTATATPATATPKNVKCTILHKERHNITVSINALPAHILNHRDTLAQGVVQPEECVRLANQLRGDQSVGSVRGKQPQQQTNEILQEDTDKSDRRPRLRPPHPSTPATVKAQSPQLTTSDSSDSTTKPEKSRGNKHIS